MEDNHRRYRQTVQTATGYEDQERVVEGPLYHGGRPNRGGQITRGRRTNSWGDEGGKSTHNYFTTDLETARQYAEQIPSGRVYEVEPTGPIKKDYAPADYKTVHPLRIVREVPRGEWMGRTAKLDEGQQRALARLRELPDDLIQGSHLHRLFAEHGIHLHDEDPYEAGEVDDDHMTRDTGRSIHHAPEVHLHTSQNNLWRPTLEHFIRNPGDSGGAERPSTWTHEGQHWINGGHHRIMADRMAQRRGTTCSDRTRTAAASGRDSDRLVFHHEEWENGGTKYPNAERITARHPEHGAVGTLQYLRGNRANSSIYIQRLEVHPDHRRKGYGSALMDTLQQRYPKARVQHGDRTDAGKAWWSSYGQGADRRGRTGTLTSGRTASVCPCGMKVIKDGDEWVHADGSVSHDGAFYGRSVADLMRVAVGLPNQRLFGPTYGLDHRLFDGDALKPDVTHYILGTLDGFWRPLYGAGWRRWARAYLAGSEASEWTSPTLEGNNDFDVLVGVHYDRARADVPLFAEASDEEITEALNRGFREGLIPRTDPTMIVIDGQETGPWSNTWFVNPASWEIKNIKPYAAYDVTNHRWAVRPPHLPSWDVAQFPEGHALVEMGEAYEKLIAAIFDLPEPYRTQQGNALWTYLHSDRSRAFSPEGEGWYDPGNVMEKWLDQKGIWADLWAVHHDADQHPEKLLAPAGWSNDPSE